MSLHGHSIGIDALAGSIAYKHVLEPGVSNLGTIKDRGFYLVTAAVDRLDMLKPLTRENVGDIRLSGQVIYTGLSSMQVVVKTEKVGPGDAEETIMLGIISDPHSSISLMMSRPIYDGMPRRFYSQIKTYQPFNLGNGR